MCVPPRVPGLRASVVSAWALSVAGRPQVSAGACAAASAQDFTLRAGGRHVQVRGASLWGGASLGPQAPGRAQAGPAPDPAPARARAARRARSPSRAAEPRRRRPWDAGIAPPGPLSLRPVPGAHARASPCRAAAAHPGTRAGGPAGERAPPPAAPAGPESSACRRPAPSQGQASNPAPLLAGPRRAPPYLPPEGRGRKKGAEQPGWRGYPGRGVSGTGARPLPFLSFRVSQFAVEGRERLPAFPADPGAESGKVWIGTRIRKAGGPKVRTATKERSECDSRERGTDRAGLGMKGPCTLLLGPAEQSAGAVLSG